MELLTEVEAAALVKVSRWTIRRLIETGRIPAKNFGVGKRKLYRLRPEDLTRMDAAVLPPPEPRRRQRKAVAAPASGRFWPQPDVTPIGTLNAWPPPNISTPTSTPKKKRGRPRVLTDEQRAAEEQAKKEKFR